MKLKVVLEESVVFQMLWELLMDAIFQSTNLIKMQKNILTEKKFYSVVLQDVVTTDLCFTDIFCSYPGAVHDAWVYQNSEVGQVMANNSNYFPQHSHLIGDAAYSLGINLLVPYKNNGHPSVRQVNFNKALSKSRVCVERAFGQLKGRFRRLKYFDVLRLEYLPLYVLAACHYA
jgi:hypothetical protein